MKKVFVIILNFKVKELALRCIESVKKSTYKNTEIILVDNDSDDGIEEDVKKFDIDFIQTGKNMGYSGGNNAGIKKALKSGADYIFILNPDTTIESDCIENIINGIEDNKADIAGPKIYFDGSKKIWYAGGIFDKENVIGSHRGVDEMDRGKYDIPEETDFVTGAAMMVKRELFDKIGLLDERYFLYYEDADFCERAKIAGFKLGRIINYSENNFGDPRPIPMMAVSEAKIGGGNPTQVEPGSSEITITVTLSFDII